MPVSNEEVLPELLLLLLPTRSGMRAITTTMPTRLLESRDAHAEEGEFSWIVHSISVSKSLRQAINQLDQITWLRVRPARLRLPSDASGLGLSCLSCLAWQTFLSYRFRCCLVLRIRDVQTLDLGPLLVPDISFLLLSLR